MTQSAGKLNHRIRLESLETSQDANGETVEAWTHEGDVWANVSPVSGKEFVSSAAMQSQIVARITVRYRDDIQATWRILFRGRYYNIEAVLADVVSGLEYLTLPCSLGIIAPDQTAWELSLPEIREFIQANYNQPNPHNQGAMVSPPTITTTDATAPSGLTQEYRYADGSDSFIRYTGGTAKTTGGTFRRAVAVTVAATGGNAGDGKDGVSWRARFVVNAQRVGVSMADNGGNFRFIVNGQYASLTGTPIAGTGGRVWYDLNFGSAATRTLAIEGHQADAFEKIATIPGAPVSAPYAYADSKRLMVIGDSFTFGTGVTLKGDSLAIVAGDMLGFQDTWASGSGGTGYVANNSGTKYRLSQRLSDVNSTGPWDVVVVAMGFNDVGLSLATIQEQVSDCLTSIRNANPSSQIFVVGPWDMAAPSAPSQSYTDTKQAIMSAIPGRMGINFIDPEGVSYSKFDGIHPNLAGHKVLGDWLAERIKSMIVG